MINPYDKVDWGKCQQVKSMSHMHTYDQTRFNKAVLDGYKHFCISHYLPSSPIYPLADYFTDIPNDVIASPNSEKVKFTNAPYHFCAVGSFAEGQGHDEASATATWQQSFVSILNQLQYADGGGIVMAHPRDANFEDRCRMLDFDNRVLGIEIYNNSYNKDKEGYTALEASKIFCGLWDRLLSSGRRCWGFAVVDWQDPLYSPWHGSNVFLVPAFTEHECLKAYRDGAFYSQIKDSGLKFTNISATATSYSVSINREATIKFITNRGVVKEVVGTSAACNVEDSDVYMRVEAIEANDETSHIFSNPTMYRNPNDSDARRKAIMRKAFILL